MEHQYHFQFEHPEKETLLTEEEILQWPEAERKAKYKELIGQAPTFDMTPHQIAQGILDPGTESDRIFALNREEDAK